MVKRDDKNGEAYNLISMSKSVQTGSERCTNTYLSTFKQSDRVEMWTHDDRSGLQEIYITPADDLDEVVTLPKKAVHIHSIGMRGSSAYLAGSKECS